jgi:N-acetylneuraminic acid mutarotase
MQLHHLPWFCVVTALFPTRLAPLRRLLNLPAFAMTFMVLVLGVRPSLAQDTNQVSFGPISVPGTSVVFGPDNVLTAAQLTALGSNGPYGATPAVKALAFPAAPGQAMVFSVSGLVGCCSVIDVGPDGYSESLSNIESLGSISGYTGIQMVLLGVFTNGDPQGAAPGNYNYSLGFGQATFAPQLNQVFFIGDGLTGTGSGSRQLFRVPNSATELWLGFADGYGFIGSAAAYGDNPGSLSASGALGSPQGTGSGLSISSSTLQFGTIPFSTTEVLLLTITNTATSGTATIGTTINGPSYKILTDAQNTCQSGVAAGESCALPVEFSPATVAPHNDFLTLTSSIDAPLSVFVRLDGIVSGVGTEMETPLNFGTVPANTTPVLPLTITNVGVPGTVTIGTSINGNSFTILTVGNTCLTGITSGQSCILPVEFSPTSLGDHNEQLTLTPSGGAAASVVHLDAIAQQVAHNTWISGAPMPTAVATQALGVINGRIYVVAGSGCSSCQYLTITQIYDPATNTWSAGAPLPVATSNGPTGAVVNNILYVFGGGTESEGVTSAVWAYNPETNSWSSKSPMPTARGCAMAAVENDIIYVVGGCGEDPFDRLTTVESYDPATDTWTEDAPLLVGKSQPSVAWVGTTIVAADGFTASGDTGDNEGYDVTTNSWTSLTPDPMARNGSCTGTIDGKLLVAGGFDTSTESFNLSNKTWKTLAPMPALTQFPGSAVYNGQLYCFGGFSGGTGLNNVQIYKP